jgi:site-specific DNA recombinase
MQGQQNNGEPYYRCRYPQEYPLANTVDHPTNIYLRESDLLEPLDAGLATAFAPHRLADTLAAMADQPDIDEPNQAIIRARAQLADCDTKLGRHRAALEAGADPKIVTGWIAEVEAERRPLLATLNQPAPEPTPRITPSPDQRARRPTRRHHDRPARGRSGRPR